jgi:hypothetical protein
MTQRVVRAGWLAVFGAVLAVPVVVRLATSGPMPLWQPARRHHGLLALSGLVCAAVLPSRVRSLTRAFGIEDILDVHRFLGSPPPCSSCCTSRAVLAMNPAQVALLDPALNGPPAKAASGRHRGPRDAGRARRARGAGSSSATRCGAGSTCCWRSRTLAGSRCTCCGSTT